MSPPFLVAGTAEPGFLYSPDGESGDVILERGGVHFINSSAFIPDMETEATLDSEFKDLVDSVINVD